MATNGAIRFSVRSFGYALFIISRGYSMGYIREDAKRYNDETLSKFIGMLVGGKWLCILLLAAAIIGGVWCAVDMESVGVFFLFLLAALVPVGLLVLILKFEKDIRAELRSRGRTKEEQDSVEEISKTWGKGVLVVTACCSCLAIIVLLIGLAIGSNDDAEKCRNCGRETDLVAGFGFCYDCYEGFVDWQEDNWTEKD